MEKSSNNCIKKDQTFNIVSTIISVLLLIVVIYPLYFVLIASVSNPDLTYAGKVYFLPKGFTLEGYRTVLKDARTFVQSDELRECFNTYEKIERIKDKEFLTSKDREFLMNT